MRSPTLFLLLTLGGCQTADSLLYQPKPDDPNDGYSSLSQAGVNTVMDWGPGQELLLKEFTTLKEQQAKMQKRLDDLLAENQNLKGQLSSETDARQKERGQRQQSDALVSSLQQRIRELEGRIFSLAIEKAKLEQTNLLAEIAKLQRSLEDISAPTDAAAPPPNGGR